MRTTLLSLAALLPLLTAAQCPFDPTITPSDLILCPNATDVLSTQAYDSYQWYKDGVAIAGETGQTLQVSSNDGGSMFTVEATLNGCTEMSPGVLVDGWVFLLPYVIHDGDAPYHVDEFGAHYCAGDTLILTLGQPYTENIQWTDGGVDIPGANSPVLIVTQDGNYSVSGAPGICPDFILGLGVTITAFFTPNIYPAIVPGDGELCVYPAIGNAQWFLDGAPIGTGECIAITAPGVYTAFADYGEPCQTISAPHLVTSVADREDAPACELNCDGDRLTVRLNDPRSRTWRVSDATGRTVAQGSAPTQAVLQLDLSDEPGGAYLFQVTFADGSTAKAQRFALVR